jgi:Flp pilus assembly pilin Flp
MLDVFQVPVLMLQYALTRHRALMADEDRELGASALEWAVISAIVVTAAVLIGTVIYNVVNNKTAAIKNCGSVANNATTGC